jgi:hypothetical protein
MKLLIATAALSLLLQAAGCHSRASRAEATKQLESKVEAKVENIKQEVKGGEPAGQSQEIDLPEREEIRQSHPLSAGATVSISGVTGLVNIETADIKTAEVHIVRSALKREDFDYHQVKIEASPTLLTIRVERPRERSAFFALFSSPPKGRQRVMLKLPREVELNANGVSGPVTVGELAGPVQMSGINGRVNVAQAAGFATLSGINGPLEATISKLSGRGVRVSGVNGNIELRFAGELNADLIVRGVNGNIEPDLPKVVTKGNPSRSNLIAQVGSGGPAITVSGINGNVRLKSAVTASSNAPASAAR